MKLMNSGIDEPEAGALLPDAVTGGRRGANYREALRVVTQKFAKLHESSRKFAQIRPVNPRFYALLRVRLFFRRLAIFEHRSVMASVVYARPLDFTFNL